VSPDAKTKTLSERIKKLEERVEALTIELETTRKEFLEALSRAVNGPSQPPPPLPGTQKPHHSDDTEHDQGNQNR
jgi:hypothetical protein